VGLVEEVEGFDKRIHPWKLVRSHRTIYSSRGRWLGGIWSSTGKDLDANLSSQGRAGPGIGLGW